MVYYLFHLVESSGGSFDERVLLPGRYIPRVLHPLMAVITRHDASRHAVLRSKWSGRKLGERYVGVKREEVTKGMVG